MSVYMTNSLSMETLDKKGKDEEKGRRTVMDLDEVQNKNLPSSATDLDVILNGLKRQGNVAFIDGSMNRAIQEYSKALEIEPLDVNVLSNRGASYIRVRYYQKAKEDLEQCMKLEEVPSIKTITRLTKAFWGLQQYDEIIELLEKMEEILPQKEINNLIKNSKSLKAQSKTGLYDLQELIRKQHQNYDCAEYVGPVKIEPVPGKGRGLVATEDITRGQVVLSSKAFAIVFPGPKTLVGPKPMLKINQNGDNYLQDFRHAKLVTIISDILEANPTARSKFYQLYAGPQLGYVDENEKVMDGSLTSEDFERINRICYFNGIFSATNPNPREIPPPVVVDEIRNFNTYGVWLLPSFINHSCIDINCDSQKYGDFMIIRALKDIPKGEELFISYTVPTKLYVERKSDISCYGFQCSCQLCQLEEKEPEDVHQKREELMQSFLQICTTSGKNENFNSIQLESIQSQIEGLRPHHPELNFSMFWINREVGRCRAGLLDYGNAALSFQASYRLSKSTCLAREGIRFAYHVVVCFLYDRNHHKAHEWMNIFKSEIIAIYGTLNVLPTIAIQEGISLDVLNTLITM